MSVADYLKGIDEVIKRDDIRGIYGKALNRNFAYNLGLLLAEGFTRAAAVWPVNVVIGHDMRLSGSVLAEGLRQGLEDGGCRPIMMGLAGTEQVGFLVARYSDVIDGGVIITASHNPRAYNGFKFFGRGGKPLSLALAEGPAPPVGEMERIARGLKKRSLPPRLDWDEFAPDYIMTIVQRGGIELERFRNVELGIAVEAGNGMGGRIIQQFAAMTPQLRWTFSNAVPDGNFPVVVPNPLQADYQRMLADVVERSGSDVGICFDVGHSNANVDDPVAEIRTAGTRIFCVHLQDNDGLGQDQHLVPGEGTVNWEAVLEALGEHAPGCWANFEVGLGDRDLDELLATLAGLRERWKDQDKCCLLYTSDAADN